MRLAVPICLLAAVPVLAAETNRVVDFDQLMRQGDLRESVRARSESALAEESVAVEQAAAQARSRSDYGLELRPTISDSEFGIGLRIYLPNRWSKDKLREQLVLVAKSEQLRIAALEWQQLLAVYRDFCTYRLTKRKLALYDAEADFVKPWLAKADAAVEQRQLAAADRARLYSLYLDLLNDREQVEMKLVDIRRRLFLALGNDAKLDVFSKTAVVAMPEQAEPGALVERALANRADYRRLGVELQSLGAAEAVAQSDEGFRFKYIQPEYQVDFDGNQEQTVGLSASFVLPWGTRNPDLAVYRQEQVRAAAAMNQYRWMAGERLKVLLKTSNAFGQLAAKQQQRVQPLRERLEADLAQMENLPLEHVRDLLAIRLRILDTELQAAEADCERQRIAVDFAEELGSLEE